MKSDRGESFHGAERERGWESGQTLKQNAIGTAGVVFFVIAASSPLAAMTGVAPVIFGSMGIGAPAVYVIAGVTLGLFAVGYTAMARHISSAAGFATYVGRGLGRRAGLATAFLSLLAYNCMLAGILGQFSVFAQDLVFAQFGVDLAWPVWAAIGLLVVGILGYLDVAISIRVIAVLMLVEVALLLVMNAATVASGGNDGINGTAFNPSHVVAAGTGIGLLFAFSSFVGFEATTIYGEEARIPHRTIPRATYITVASITVFYGFTMWSIGVGYGNKTVLSEANADPVNMVFSLGGRYVGSYFSDLMQAFVFTALIAAMAAFQNVLSRYIFSLARIGAMPRMLSRTHVRHQAPSAASLFQSAVSIIIVSAFIIGDADPFFHLFSWLVGLGSLSILTLEILVAVSVVVFFRRNLIDSRIWNTLVAPLLGFVGLTTVVYLAFDNFDVLVGTSVWAKSLILLIPASILIGLSISNRREVGDISRSS